jgi:hypothetical protein
MDSPEPRQSEAPGAPVHRSYEPPAIAWEEDFTPYAYAGCGKMMGQGGACVIRRSS